MKKNDLPGQLPCIFRFNGLVQFDQCIEVGVLIDILDFQEIFHKQNAYINLAH